MHGNPITAGNYTTSTGARDKNGDGYTVLSKRKTGTQQAMMTIDSTSVIIVVGEKEEHVIVSDVALAQGRSEITLDRIHRFSSVKRHHLEQLNAVRCESVNESAVLGVERLTCPCPV